MGGQVGDSGMLINGDESTVITTTKKENNLAVHISDTLPQEVTATFRAVINKEARIDTSCNHTATHLLHEALREVLGKHVEQKGSYVSPYSLRFDFSHFQKVTDEELRQVERIANAKVRMAIPLDEHRHMPIAEARAMGAMALFGEKYGEEVRVVRYGTSVELCGGTHVPNTGNIGMIRIISESSIAAGIRRIEAITGRQAEEATYRLQDTLKQISSLFNNAPNLRQAIEKHIAENADLRHQIEEFAHEKSAQIKASMIQEAKVVNNIRIVSYRGPMMPIFIKNIAFEIRGEMPERTALVAATFNINDNNKPLLTVALSDDLVAQGKNASQIVREAARLIQGGGGGQPHFAQAGGKDFEKLSEAFEKMKELVIA